MTFVDASALVAIILGEAEGTELLDRLLAADTPITSAIAAWEAMRAICRVTGCEPTEADKRVEGLLRHAQVRLVSIAAAERTGALDAHARFGKGRHPAGLNMGDCFAYACARTHGARLLYKGDDFAHTDIEGA